MRKQRNLLSFDQNICAMYSNICAVYPNICAVYPNKNHVTTHPDTLPGRSFKVLNVCMVLKNLYRVHVKGVKGIFVPRSDNLCMGTELLDLTMQKVSTAGYLS